MRPRAFRVGAQHLLERVPALGRRAVSLDTSVELILERSKRHVGERVLATIVATAGSTYRKAGARMLLMADGNYSGLLSGGCFEADLVAHAREVLKSGAARVVEYDMRGPDDALFGIGAGCEGAMLVLLEGAGSHSRAEKALAQTFTDTPSNPLPLIFTIYESRNWPLGTYSGTELPSVFCGPRQSERLRGGLFAQHRRRVSWIHTRVRSISRACAATTYLWWWPRRSTSRERGNHARMAGIGSRSSPCVCRRRTLPRRRSGRLYETLTP